LPPIARIEPPSPEYDRVRFAHNSVQRTCIKDSYAGQACKVTSAKL